MPLSAPVQSQPDASSINIAFGPPPSGIVNPTPQPTPPPSSVPIVPGVLNTLDGAYQPQNNMSVDDLFAAIIQKESDPFYAGAKSIGVGGAIIPYPGGSRTNRLIAGSSIQTLYKRAINDGTDNMTVSNKKFTPYESLTGISQERPEIILSTDFEPLFMSDVSNSQTIRQTSAHQLFDMQMFLRIMRHYNVRTMMASAAQSQNMKKVLSARANQFEYALQQLNTTTNSLYSMIMKLENLKSSLDLRSSLYNFKISDMSTTYSQTFSPQSNFGSYVLQNHGIDNTNVQELQIGRAHV